MTGALAVQARIAEIQTRFAPVAVPPAVARTAPPTSVAQAGGVDFAQLVEQALAGTGPARPATPSGAAAPPADPGSGVSGADVVAAAKKYLGVPYLWGGTDPSKGLDCSGFIQRTYADLGIEIPRVSRDQARAGTAVPNLASARPGDLVAFNNPVDHIGIYIGDGKMIVAPQTGDVVKIQDVYKTPTAIRRILPDSDVAASGATPAVGQARLAAGTPYADLFAAAGARHGVDARLLAEVARAESGFNPRAVSRAGAEGLMQLMPGTAKELGVANSFDPAQAVDGAARLLASHLRSFGSTDLALAAYNAGPGAVRRYDGVPPYAETQAYVRKITSALGAAA